MDIFYDSELVFSDTYAPKHTRTLLVNTNAPLHSINGNVPPSAGVFNFPPDSPFSDRFLLWRAIGQKLYIEERSVCRTVIGGTLCLDFARTSIVPGTSITLLDQSILCIIVPTQSTVHRFHARLVHDISDLFTSDTCNGILSEISDSEFLNDYHSSYLLTTNGQATKAAVVDLQDNGSTAKIAYCMAEGELVVVTLSASKAGYSGETVYQERGLFKRIIKSYSVKEGVADICGLISNGEQRNVESFYAVHRDLHLRVWSTESAKARSIPLDQYDSSLREFSEICTDSALGVRAFSVNGVPIIIVFISAPSDTPRFHFIADHNKKLHHFGVITDSHKGRLLDFGLTFKSGQHPKLWALWNNLSVTNEYLLQHTDVSLDFQKNCGLGVWNLVRSYSLPKAVSSEMSANDLRETVFNADCYPYDVVHRAIKVCCEGNLCEDKHGNWQYLSDTVDIYMRSPEFDSRYVDRRKSLRLSMKEVHAEAEKKLLFELASTCDQLELAARGPVGLFLLDIPGACLAGVIQQDRFSVVLFANPVLKETFKLRNNGTMERALQEINEHMSEQDNSSEEGDCGLSSTYDFNTVSIEHLKSVINEFMHVSENDTFERTAITSVNQKQKSTFGGQFTCGLIFATLRKRIRERVEFARSMIQLLNICKKEINSNTYVNQVDNKFKTILTGYNILLSQLDMKVSSTDSSNKYVVLGSWFLEKNDLSQILNEGGITINHEEDIPEFNNFFESLYLASLSILWEHSSSTLLLRSLVAHKQFTTLKKLCAAREPPAHLVNVMRFYAAIAYSGIGQPGKAMTAFIEASGGVTQQNPAMMRALRAIGNFREDISLGEYYTMTIGFLSDHGHSEEVVEMSRKAIEQLPEGNENTSRIYATLFNHLVNKSNWVDALSTIQKNKNSEDRRLTLREFITRLLHAKEYKTLVELRYGELEENVEEILMAAARAQDVHTTPHLFEIVFSYYTLKSDYAKAAQTMYEYAILLSQVTQTPELLKRRRDAIAISSSSLDLQPDGGRFLWFPEEVSEIDYEQSENISPSVTPDDDDRPVIKRRKIRILTGKDICDEFIIANARVAIIDSGKVPPTISPQIVKELVAAKHFDLAFEVCRNCDIPTYDLFFDLTKECILLDIQQPEIQPDWIQKNRRYTSGKAMEDSWSIATGLLGAARKIWPADSRPYRAMTNALLSQGMNIPYWLQAEYADHDIADFVRCLLDYNVVQSAFSVLTNFIERETDKVKSIDDRTWLPYTVIDELLKTSVQAEYAELVVRLNDCLKMYKARVSSFEMAAQFAS